MGSRARSSHHKHEDGISLSLFLAFVLGLLLLGFVAFFSSHALAVEKPFPVVVPEKVDLKNEMAMLNLGAEQALASDDRVSPMSLQFGLGLFTASQALEIDGYTRTVRYESLSNEPMATVGVQGYPWESRRRLGWALKAGYSRVDLETKRATTLHLVPMEATVGWRFASEPTARWVPAVHIGAVGFGFVQRGVIETDNSSGVRAAPKLSASLLWRPYGDTGFFIDYSNYLTQGSVVSFGADLQL